MGVFPTPAKLLSSAIYLDFLLSTDGTVHNLNEYLAMSSLDVVKSIGSDAVDAALTQKLGVLVGESKLEEFFSQIPL